MSCLLVPSADKNSEGHRPHCPWCVSKWQSLKMSPVQNFTPCPLHWSLGLSFPAWPEKWFANFFLRRASAVVSWRYTFRQRSPETVCWAGEIFWGQKPDLVKLRGGFPLRAYPDFQRGWSKDLLNVTMVYHLLKALFWLITVNSHHYGRLWYFIFSYNGVRKKINHISLWSSFVQTQSFLFSFQVW